MIIFLLTTKIFKNSKTLIFYLFQRTWVNISYFYVIENHTQEVFTEKKYALKETLLYTPLEKKN